MENNQNRGWSQNRGQNQTLAILTFACSALNLIAMTTTMYLIYRLENNHKSEIKQTVSTIEQINADWPEIQTILVLVRENLPSITSAIQQFSTFESFVQKINTYIPSL